MYKEGKDYSCGKDTLEFFFGCIGYFNHYSYFTKKLWQKVNGFKNEDEAEVKCAFMSWWCYNKMGIVTYPCGMAWCTFDGDKECFDAYVEKWMPVFEDFTDWQLRQR